mgnify:CR=1
MIDMNFLVMDSTTNNILQESDVLRVQNALQARQVSVLARTIFEMDNVMACIKGFLLHSAVSVIAV